MFNLLAVDGSEHSLNAAQTDQFMNSATSGLFRRLGQILSFSMPASMKTENNFDKAR
jgi:hypothetical protein